MSIGRLIIILCLFILCTGSALCDSSGEIRERIRLRIEAAGIPPSLQVGEESIYASIVLPIFYERRAYEPAWIKNNKPAPIVKDLLHVLQSASKQGLRASDYHVRRIESVFKQTESGGSIGSQNNPTQLVDLELLCTDAFLIFGAHLLKGRVDPITIDAEWHANLREVDMAGVLQTAVTNQAVDSVLQSLLPPQKGYDRLMQALERYRIIEKAGGWENIPDGPGLSKGKSDNRVADLRERLYLTGDLADTTGADETVFDSILETAVISFQLRHGLTADGKAGPATIAALNVPVRSRIQQIIANLERWRWLPQELGKRNVIVNIANFELDLNYEESTLVSMRVIVGKAYRRTPVFSDYITYMVLNPTWNVPRSIALADILPMVKKDVNYLAENDFELLSDLQGRVEVIDPMTVDWSAITTENFPYRLRQKPGSKNNLGRIKFMFPNQFNVYLHDTPAKGLFSRERRNFSSGCIRIEKPAQLAEFLLLSDSSWTMKRLESQLAAGNEQTVALKKPVPVHILYWTAWAAADGTVHFREDLYHRDTRLIRAIFEQPDGDD
ncbi:MAG: L,D-transpeptidase family protein [Candidatus Zixiibacteriota bacterium]